MFKYIFWSLWLCKISIGRTWGLSKKLRILKGNLFNFMNFSKSFFYEKTQKDWGKSERKPTQGMDLCKATGLPVLNRLSHPSPTLSPCHIGPILKSSAVGHRKSQNSNYTWDFFSPQPNLILDSDSRHLTLVLLDSRSGPWKKTDSQHSTNESVAPIDGAHVAIVFPLPLRPGL